MGEIIIEIIVLNRRLASCVFQRFEILCNATALISIKHSLKNCQKLCLIKSTTQYSIKPIITGNEAGFYKFLYLLKKKMIKKTGKIVFII